MNTKYARFAPILAALLPLSAFCTPVVVGDTEWQQPDLLTGFSWYDIAKVCPTDGAACAGTLDTIDVTGWTWASVSEVASLFAAMEGHPGNRGSHTEPDSRWAPQFLTLFTPTLQAPGAAIVHGWTRSSDPFNGYYTLYMFDHYANGATDVSRVRRLPIASVSSDMIGAWLYRDYTATAVPEPSPVSLIAVGLLGLVMVRARKVRALALKQAAPGPRGQR